jgi:energy-coupling factor transporter ATP-binding protein EcfA2
MNVIEVQDLHFCYPDGSPALRGVSFGVADGECVGVIGPNGAGKSTLLLHLNGLLPESPGKDSAVRVLGRPALGADIDTIRRHVGLLFQDPDDQIFCSTVFEDVAFGPEQLGLDQAEIDRRVKESLEKVGLGGFEGRSPHHLSGGEKRRVCLAGVMTCQSSILALDEPTSGLDPRGRREFRELLRTLPVTKIIATHDLELVAELCSRAIVLDEGVVVANGPALEILSDEALMLEHGLEKPHILQHRHPHDGRAMTV